MSKTKKQTVVAVQPVPLDPSNTSTMLTNNVMQSVGLNVSLDTNDLIALYVTEYDAAVNRKIDALRAERQQLLAQRSEINDSDLKHDYPASAKNTPEAVAFIASCKAVVKVWGHPWKEEMISCDGCMRHTTSCRLTFTTALLERTTKVGVTLSASCYVSLEPDPMNIGPRLKEMDEKVTEISNKINGLSVPVPDRDKERNARAIITKLKLASMSGSKVNMPELIAKLQEGFAAL